MISSEKALGELSKQAQNKDFRFKDLYRNLYNPDFYIKAYTNIYSNKGSATSGIDKVTADGFSEDRINKIILSLKDESYKPKAVKRTYIPKKGGKLRPLGIPTFDDRLVQEVCRMILEKIYEPIFSESSHGFRPERSCHTALTEVRNKFKGVNWFIEGDIKGCFDNIDHHVLINILRKKITDERFISLIWKFLRSGYLENYRNHKTYSGSPQGGIISPILANIYLNEFDDYVLRILKDEFTSANIGGVRENKVINPRYTALKRKMGGLKNIINRTEDKDQKDILVANYLRLRKEKNKEKYSLGLGNYHNLFYVRYADDFILGIHGSKEDCRNIKVKICNFLQKTLKLELSEEKTLITNSSSKARFLNYEIQVRENNKFFERTDGIKQRSGNRSITLTMPADTMFSYIKDIVQDINAEQWRGKARTYLQGLSNLEIVSVYNAELRGLYNYYALAENVSDRMDMIYHVMEYSCLKTLAGKYKTSVSQMKNKLRIGTSWGVKYNTKEEENKIRFFYNQGFKMRKMPYTRPEIDNIPNTLMYSGRTELECRMIARKCEMCGKENVPFHIHHVHKVKDLKGKEIWEQVMIAKRRKTLVLCENCHKAIHNS